jgi:hypothetical protein
MFKRACSIPCVTFHNKLVFYAEEELVPYPTPKLEDHPLFSCPQTANSIHLQLPSNCYHYIQNVIQYSSLKVNSIPDKIEIIDVDS